MILYIFQIKTMESSWKCGVCDIQLSRKQRLISHYERVHPNAAMPGMYGIQRLKSDDYVLVLRARFGFCLLQLLVFACLLPHLSRRIIGELIVYLCSGVRPSCVLKVKHLLLRNHMANQSQILCGASLGRGKESLFR